MFVEAAGDRWELSDPKGEGSKSVFIGSASAGFAFGDVSGPMVRPHCPQKRACSGTGVAQKGQGFVLKIAAQTIRREVAFPKASRRIVNLAADFRQ